MFTCKSKCISVKNMEVDFSRCVGCYNCISVCDDDAIKYVPYYRKPLGESNPDKNRRMTLAVFGTVILGLFGFRKILRAQEAVVENKFPTEIEPERDLTADIASRTWDSVPGRTGRAQRRLTWKTGQRSWLAAAAVVLVVASSALTVLVMRAIGGRQGQVASAPLEGERATLASTALAEDLRLVALEYEAAVDDLRAVLEANRGALEPGTMEIVEDNLAILDAALRETVEALRSAPADARLRQTMVATYERKLDFLRQAVALTAES